MPQWIEFIKDLTRANKSRKDLDAVFELTRLWMAEQRLDLAQQVLLNTLKTTGPSAPLYLMLGLVYQKAQAPYDALRAFEYAVELQDASPHTHFYLGAQLERLHRQADARAQFRRTLELDPNHGDALNYLGYMDAEDGVNLQEAKALIMRALAIYPENGAYIDSLGWVYYKMGQLDEAIRQLERATELLKNDPTVFEHLGEAYLKRGQPDQARLMWEKALELDEHSETASRKLHELLQREATAAGATTPK